MRQAMLGIPNMLEQLILEGRWPRLGEGVRETLVAPERIRELAPGESNLCLYPPPFRVIGESPRRGNDPFWNHLMSAPWEIDIDLAIAIGDFGLGSDAPILLDYRENIEKPRVIRLRWGDGVASKYDNHWVEMAPDFETFVRVLGL